MTKKEQKEFIENAMGRLERNGILIEHFINNIGMSRTHLFFIRKAERILTDEKAKKISEFIDQRCFTE